MHKHTLKNVAAFAALLGASGALLPSAAHAQAPLVLKENMAVLNAQMPDTTYRFLGSNAPGQLFLPKEPVNVQLAFTKGKDTGTVRDFALEIQEITTRDPEKRIMSSTTDTSGAAPLIGVEGPKITKSLVVTFSDAAETTMTVPDVPLPTRYGTYALVLTRGTGATQTRQFLGTLARVPNPNPAGTIDNVPIFGEGQMMDGSADTDVRAKQYLRMGVRGWRTEMGWIEKPDGTTDWTNTDNLMSAAANNGCGIMVTLGGTNEQWRPFGVPIPASRWTPESGGYRGTGDWLMAPKDYPHYGKWITEFANRYWKGGKGGLWGLENYNEPWEGGGISGWARDARQFRELQKTIAGAARSVDPRIKLLAACSVMNTEDKLYSDGTNAMDPFVDIFTDHYVVPPMCYGPMVAAAHEKQSMETETWFVNSEYLLPQGVTQFLGSGQAHIAPWHPRVLFDTLPGSKDNYLIPTPVVTATAAFNSFVTGKKFNKMVFSDHLPFLFQFGENTDKDALLVMFGQLLPIGNDSPKAEIWAQVNGAKGGTITIQNPDGLLQFFDPAGNPEYVGLPRVTLPLNIAATYIKCSKGPVAAAARINEAFIQGKRPVEILPHDFSSPLSAASTLSVSVHNCLNRPISGGLALGIPATLKAGGATTQTLALKAGETRTVSFSVAPMGKIPAGTNSFPMTFDWKSDGGNASYAENMNQAIAVHRTMKMDGNYDEWNDVPGVTVIGTTDKVDPTELLRRPWLDVSRGNPTATVGELKMAWDDNFLYLAARVQDPTPELHDIAFSKRDEDSYFHSAASDNEEPYKTFINDFRKKTGDPKRSFAEVPYVYKRSPEDGIPFRRDRLQIALDTTPGLHDMKEVTNVPYGFHAMPDTDYEYSIYGVAGGGSEVWRHLAPGVPRINDFPHQVRGARTTGLVAGAQSIVKRDGNTYTYEVAIPKSELADLKLQGGTNFGFSFVFGNSNGPKAEYGLDKAVNKLNGLTLHPYWETHPSDGVRWTLSN